MTKLGIASRMMFVFAVIAATQVGIAALGLRGFRLSNDELGVVYHQRLVPVSELSRINELMPTSIEQLTIAVIARPSPKNVQVYIDRVEKNLAAIGALVQAYAQNVGDGDSKKLLEDWNAKRAALIDKGIKPAIAALKAQKFNDAEDAVLGVAVKQFEATQKVFNDIVAAELQRAEQAQNEANDRYDFTKKLTISAVTPALALCALIAFYVKRSITGPLRLVTSAMNSLANGDRRVDIPHAGRADEVGETARAAQAFKDSLLRIDGLEAERRAAQQAATADRQTEMCKLADRFEAAVDNVEKIVSAASTELESSATTLTRTAETTRQLSLRTADAFEEASGNVRAVAFQAEELSSSVNEIGRQVKESSRIAGEAVHQAEKTDARVAELSRAASRIGDVVKLITAIAEQTNLLALNAAIEAARAGEAGRGFAVVAAEVKSLANQTAKATEEISTHIAGMQTATTESVAAIKEIGGTIARISEIAGTISAAVEAQDAATQGIARNVELAAQGTAKVAGNIGDVSRGALETGSASNQVLTSAKSLSAEGNKLKLEVDKFLMMVRAA